MLHASQDASCSEAVAFWNSPQGTDAFFRLVGTFVHPPPARDDSEALSTLRRAVPPRLVAAAPEDVDARVHDAARDVAHRMRMSRELSGRFHDFCSQPTPPRHAVYVGPSDRPANVEELAVPMAHNPHFQKWMHLRQGDLRN